jgi:hypothetical protein
MPQDEWQPRPEQRVSGLAVSSLVIGLLCCLPIGSIATVLGIGGIYSISKSNGRLTGSGMAAIGMILGLLSTTVWVGLFVSARSMYQGLNQSIVVPMQQFSGALEQGDWAGAKAMFAATSAVTEADLSAFNATIQADLGKFQGMPKDFSPWKGFSNRGQNQKQAGDLMKQAGGFPIPIPFPLQFEKGIAMVFPIAQSEDFLRGFLWGTTSLKGEMINLVVMKPDGTQIWLRTPAKLEGGSESKSGAEPEREPALEPGPR